MVNFVIGILMGILIGMFITIIVLSIDRACEEDDMIEYYAKLEDEIERLNNIIKQYDKISFIHEMELQKRIDKAIEFGNGLLIGEATFEERHIANRFLNILKGVDKE